MRNAFFIRWVYENDGWLLAIGFWLLAIGFWLLAVGLLGFNRKFFY